MGTDSRHEPGHAYHEDWDYHDSQRLREFERKLWWVVTYEGIPVQAWGYLGAYEGRPDDWWFPYCGYSTKPSENYFSMSEDWFEAVAEAWIRYDKKQAELYKLRRAIRKVQGDVGHELAE